MYDELVERLRYCADSDNQCLECKYRFGSPDGSKMCLDLLMVDAADAIEELSMKLHGDEAAIAGMKREIERMVVAGKPRWIPVTEQKPPLPEDEDVCYVQVIAAVKGKKEAEPVLYSRAYRLRDGKRVRIERFVGDGEVLEVTHWMPKPPMPKPPKEEP